MYAASAKAIVNAVVITEFEIELAQSREVRQQKKNMR